jgi:uncharacterized membrane protein
MQPITIRVFVSSTWLDLKPERDALESLLQRFRETKFIGMEYFGSRDETTRGASLDEIDRSDLYLGIIGGRYGSGITEAEYDRARKKPMPCLVYFKQESQVPPEGRNQEPAHAKLLAKFKAKLKDHSRGHTIAEFSGPFELASIVASDLHNWLVEQFLAPATGEAARGNLSAEQSRSLERALRELAAMNRDLQREVARERSNAEAQRRVALDAFYRLTYEPRGCSRSFPTRHASGNSLCGKPWLRWSAYAS